MTIIHKPSAFICVLILIFQYSKSVPSEKIEQEKLKNQYLHLFWMPYFFSQQSSEKSVKPVSLLHGEPTVFFDSEDLETFITKENLKFALITKFSYRSPGLPYLWKILSPQLGFKSECNIGLLESRHVLLRFTLKDYIAIFSKTSRSISLRVLLYRSESKSGLLLVLEKKPPL